MLFSRLEFEWLHPHPPLSLLDERLVWIQAGEDNGGITDRHWLSNRADADVLMRRWEAILDGSALTAIHGGSDLNRVTPVFVSSEVAPSPATARPTILTTHCSPPQPLTSRRSSQQLHSTAHHLLLSTHSQLPPQQPSLPPVPPRSTSSS